MAGGKAGPRGSVEIRIDGKYEFQIHNFYLLKEDPMAQKSGTLKRFILTLIFVVLIVVVFILLGGGNLLKSAGRWMSGVGSEAETVKQKMEDKASSTGKAVEKVIETVKPGEKTGEKK
jgi:Sec-independent protein translocase protein TatA